MDSTSIVLVLCGIVILSYLFEIFARKTGIPSVLFLILTGVLLNKLTVYFDTPPIDYLSLIPVIGTVGLILIVFEGALDIEFRREKKGLFVKVLTISIILLLLTSGAMSLFFRYKTGAGFYRCFLNSIPYSIISSAIAIPSAVHLSTMNRDFITLESSLSDILGIVLFNYFLAGMSLSFGFVWKIVFELILVTAVSFIFCLFLLYLLRSIEHNIKFILILAVLVFLYALGKSIHVSSLIMILMFGLILKNINQVNSDFINTHFNNQKFFNDFNFLHQITAEGVFLIKTFFFIIFGFIIHPVSLVAGGNIKTSLLITAIIFLVRFVSLLVVRQKVFPEIFYAPRGLISILLFLSLPVNMGIEMLNIDVLFLVVIITSVIMILGSFWRESNVPGLSENENKK